MPTTSQNNQPGWRRLTSNKTHRAFETIPSLRVPGNELPSAGSGASRNASNAKATPTRPAQYADPTVFPGRRLDRRQPSGYSGVSGVSSGLSGLEQMTLNSAAGKFRAAVGSVAGSTRLSHASLPTIGAGAGSGVGLNNSGNNGRPLQADVHDPWSSARQTREDSPLTMLKRQAAAAGSLVAGASSTATGGRLGDGGEHSLLGSASHLPFQSSFSKVHRWQQANFVQPNKSNRPLPMDTHVDVSTDSESQGSDAQHHTTNRNLYRHQQVMRQEQHEREARLKMQQAQRQMRGRHTPPVITVEPSRSAQGPHQNPQQQQTLTQLAQSGGAKQVSLQRRPAHTAAGSPKPSADPGLQFNKILWALVPDEHGNTSEAGARSHIAQSSCKDTSVTVGAIDQVKDHNNSSSVKGTDNDNVNKDYTLLNNFGPQVTKDKGHFVMVTDLDLSSDDSTRFIPDTPKNPPLTEKLLIGLHNETGGFSREDRIFQWLAECDKETVSQSLPTHLPDIKYTFKFLKSGAT